MSATRRVRQPRSVTGAKNSSYGLAWNSFDASARPSSPPVAASRPGTAAARSPWNHGTISRSASIADNGPLVHAIGVDGGAGDIRLLSLMTLAGVSPARYNLQHSSCRGEDHES